MQGIIGVKSYKSMNLIKLYYGSIEPPKWKRKYSFAVLYTLLFLLSSYLMGAIAFVDGIDAASSGEVYYLGFPLTWIRVSFGFGAPMISGVEPDLLGLLVDSSIWGMVCILLIYPDKLIKLLIEETARLIQKCSFNRYLGFRLIAE
jgi:hypothetical protein